jgi:hypothetical protein
MESVMSEDATRASEVPSLYERLARRFPAEAHKTKTISGRDLTYVDGEMVVSRLNEELGLDGWSFETCQINVLDKEVWATGRLTVYVGDRTIVREQAGGQIINRTRAGEIIELSNDIKGAVTDCLKKCATLVGVGLYLYDPEERREVESEMREAKRGGNRPASRVAPTKEDKAAVVTGADPTVLKTKLELIADLQRGIEYARSLGLDPDEVDGMKLNRVQLEETIASLRKMCRDVLAERKRQAS